MVVESEHPHGLLLAEYAAGLGLSTDPHPALSAVATQAPYLAATLPATSLAAGAVAAFACAANRVRRARGLDPRPHVLHPDRIAAGFRSEHLIRVGDQRVSGFADMSGFFPTADGMVRTHANYPHHRQRLLTLLRLPADATRDDAAARMRNLAAADVEDLAARHDAIAFRVRTETEWAETEAGQAAATGPLVSVTPRADHGRPDLPGAPTSDLPLAGVRVLDLTRVLAGPTATRALALLGAQVLRLDPPWLPEIEWQHLDTGQGKNTALLDIHTSPDTFADLVRRADVLVTGYRPGALPESVPATIHPGVVHGQVSAWGERGPWAGRRGFDSVVQAASGIALLEGNPGTLPGAVLDYGTGYLLAAGILDALAAHTHDGAGRDVRVSLARTASWLLRAPGRTAEHPRAVLPGPETTVRHGTLTTSRPVLAEYPDYPWPAHPHGSDKPTFPQ